ncbi:disease resistance protein RPM1-like protein [Cinnamomum micranthum f. kanehirae]|uniref:Disease resistance protein RPM1-like protein n=1 Tax=Cinnamomum micranthum f. kanehirae TaxID=337451 RepID=A0A3S3NR59_9MAGN|nr:disease resistance protein RPM1-like protein [Cinnamomum micranthum f. kanehirae]
MTDYQEKSLAKSHFKETEIKVSEIANMADGAVRFLLQTVGSLLAKEAFMLGSLRPDLEYIKSNLEIIQSFLKDSDSSKESSSSLKRTWRRQLNDAAYDVEDLIDEFVYHMDKDERRGRLMGFLHNAVSLPRSIFVSHGIATRLHEIKAKLLDISESAKLLPHEESSSSLDAGESWPYYAESSHFVVEEELVGIRKNRKKLIRWLKDKRPQRRVISVVGMGGLGKTILVTEVFNSLAVKEHFNCYAWISVSQSYKIEELLQRVIKELYASKKDDLPNNLYQMDYRRLVEMLVNYLQDKRYVIVLDDVWNIKAWDDISIAIPSNHCGSRVMLTSRNRDLRVKGKVFYLRPLKRNEAWELFCKKAFWNIPKRRCPQELEPAAKKIVGKCEGLPLAIVAIGGIMSRKEIRESEWKKVEDSLGWELSNNPDLDRMKNILLHSYYDLPYHLKSCFLYFSVFPRGRIINRAELIRLWVAEGFVEVRRDLTMEDIAENYLRELIHRSMIQAVGKGSCRLHDVMRDLAQSIAEEENFCMLGHGKEERRDFKARRLSIQFNGGDISRSKASMSRLRSFFVFGKDVIPSSSLNRISSTFKQLRVLRLEDASIHKVPDELVNLFNLRFLSLRNTKVRELPKSLARLRNLQTLDTRHSNVKMLPGWIKKMKKLRHLYTYRSAIPEYVTYNCRAPIPIHRYFRNGVQAPPGICDLKCLQSLLTVKANAKIVEQVGNLTRLRELGITNVRKDHGKKLCSSIQRIKGLRGLSIKANNGETLQVEELSSPPHRLQRLVLEGHLEKLPHWITSLRNLTSLRLRLSELKEDPLPQIGSLPNMLVLSLYKAYRGQQLCFVAGCFPRLKKLYLCGLENLNHVRIEQGAMPSIKMLFFSECAGLTTLPKGIEHLSGLRELHLMKMPEKLIEQLKEDGSEVQKMVQHIPIIQNTFWKDGKWVSEDVPHLLSQHENGLKRPQIAPSMDVGEAKNSASMSFHVRAGLLLVVGCFFAFSLLIWLLFTWRRLR